MTARQELAAAEVAGLAEAAPALFETAWDADAIAGLLETPGCFAFTPGDEPASGLILARVAADECEILWLIVDPARRQQGLARGLLRAALARAADLGARSVYLEVAERNRAAVGLYDSEGFLLCGERPNYYPSKGSDGPDSALLYRKSLEIQELHRLSGR